MLQAENSKNSAIRNFIYFFRLTPYQRSHIRPLLRRYYNQIRQANKSFVLRTVHHY